MYDIVIVGGGAIGISIAYFCKKLSPGASVAVIERDVETKLSSTETAGSGGSRRLFFCPENVQMSDFSIKFIKEFEQNNSGESSGGFGWKEKGYLFIVPPAGLDMLQSNLEQQLRLGVQAEFLDQAALADKFPILRVDDLGGGVYSPEDGWFDAQSYLSIMRNEARALGVDLINDEVLGFNLGNRAVTSARLKSGRIIDAHYFVNAAGPWAGNVSAMIGMPVPIQPMRRFEHIFSSETSCPTLPYVKDVGGLAIRSHGSRFSGGLVQTQVPRGFSWEVDPEWFEKIVQPAVSWRFPGIGRTECEQTWAGLYEQCDFDGNPIIGAWTGNYDNFFVAAGFSGHGLMHAPATGRAMAELLVHGKFITLDLQRFGYHRIERNEPYRERGII